MIDKKASSFLGLLVKNLSQIFEIDHLIISQVIFLHILLLLSLSLTKLLTPGICSSVSCTVFYFNNETKSKVFY